MTPNIKGTLRWKLFNRSLPFQQTPSSTSNYLVIFRFATRSITKAASQISRLSLITALRLWACLPISGTKWNRPRKHFTAVRWAPRICREIRIALTTTRGLISPTTSYTLLFKKEIWMSFSQAMAGVETVPLRGIRGRVQALPWTDNKQVTVRWASQCTLTSPIITVWMLLALAMALLQTT